MTEQTLIIEQILAQTQTLTLFQEIHLMDKLAEAIAHEVKQFSWQEWHDFIDRTAGSLADDPMERPPQGEFEQRDEIL